MTNQKIYFKNIAPWVIGVCRILIRIADLLVVGTSGSVVTDLTTGTINGTSILKGSAALIVGLIRVGLQAFVDYSDTETPAQ